MRTYQQISEQDKTEPRETARSDTPVPEIRELKAVIPTHCFTSSLARSFAYLLRDLIYVVVLLFLAFQIRYLPNNVLKGTAWILYSFLQGCVGTGLWIIGHECGHGAFSSHKRLNDVVGWLIHSALLVPYFSWKITHARHHRYTGHLEKDVVFVPETQKKPQDNKAKLEIFLHNAEDAPVVTLFKLLRHQLLGWQIYLFFNTTAGKDSLPQRGSNPIGGNHLNPFGALFLTSQRWQVIASNIGISLTLGLLYWWSTRIGLSNVLLLYLVPYLWVHHWIVAITYLHHTHPSVPYHLPSSWTFTAGALGTIDRSLGFMGRHFFHEIVDYHVIHHLFPKIPFYHAEEATRAIQPLLGHKYVQAKDENFWGSLWNTYRTCQFLTEEDHDGGERSMFVWATGTTE